MMRAGLLVCFVVWCWNPHFLVDAGNVMQYSWGDQNVKGIFHIPEQRHFKSVPIHEVTWPGKDKDRPLAPESNPPPPVLPMFWHAPEPLVRADLFKPVVGKHPLPNALIGLLLPHRHKPPNALVQQPLYELDVPKVEATCGSSMIGVRVNMKYLGFKADPSMFRLGTCIPTFVTREYLYFQYYLNECGSESKVRLDFDQLSNAHYTSNAFNVKTFFEDRTGNASLFQHANIHPRTTRRRAASCAPFRPCALPVQ